MKKVPEIVRSEIVHVDNLEDLCEVVFDNNEVFVKQLNNLNRAIYTETRKNRRRIGFGYLFGGLTLLMIAARFENVEAHLDKCEERLGIAAAKEE